MSVLHDNLCQPFGVLFAENMKTKYVVTRISLRHNVSMMLAKEHIPFLKYPSIHESLSGSWLSIQK